MGNLQIHSGQSEFIATTDKKENCYILDLSYNGNYPTQAKIPLENNGKKLTGIGYVKGSWSGDRDYYPYYGEGKEAFS